MSFLPVNTGVGHGHLLKRGRGLDRTSGTPAATAVQDTVRSVERNDGSRRTAILAIGSNGPMLSVTAGVTLQCDLCPIVRYDTV
jgi:hypothetical protein